jgi:two-component system, chemotaxis family, protein-glutamate methylesterase/glutaminase
LILLNFVGARDCGIGERQRQFAGASSAPKMWRLFRGYRATGAHQKWVFGMPKEAIAYGAVEKVVSLAQIPREIMLWQDVRHPNPVN